MLFNSGLTSSWTMSLRIKYMHGHRIKASCVAKVEMSFFTTYLLMAKPDSSQMCSVVTKEQLQVGLCEILI